MRIASFKVSDEFLCGMLHLPAGTQICGAEYSYADRTVRLTVEHHELAEQPAHAQVPECNPRWTRHQEITFDGWGQQ